MQIDKSERSKRDIVASRENEMRVDESMDSYKNQCICIFRFNILSVVQAGDMDRRKLKQSLQILVRTVSRVMLLHAE